MHTTLPRGAATGLLIIGLLIAAAGCERSSDVNTLPSEQSAISANTDLLPQDPELAKATEAAWLWGQARLTDVQIGTLDLHRAIEALLDTPDQEHLDTTQAAWHHAHRQWLQLTPLLALTDSHPGLFSGLEYWRNRIDAQPMEPGYLDYLDGYPYSGIVNDITLDINATNLRQQHGLTDASDVSLGFHALEFLLWGEDGQRPVDDYIERTRVNADEREQGLTVVDLSENRRRSLVLLTSHLLQDDLRQLAQLWEGPNGTVTQGYYQLSPQSRLQLLQESSYELLTHTLPGLLYHDQETVPHNRFAGGSLQQLSIGLSALKDLWLSDETGLAGQLLADEETLRVWRSGFAEALQKASTLEEGTLTDEQREGLLDALQQQASPFAPAREALL